MSKYDKNRREKYEVIGRLSEMGKTRVGILCPFCNTDFWAYVWSLCGGGKKCPGCGALHDGFGAAVPVKKGS